MSHLTLNEYNTILYSDNDVFTNHSDSMRRWDADNMTGDIVAAEDKIYIGCPHTFAARFVKMSQENDVSGVLTVKYYAGSTNGWRPVKNLADETSYGGVPFSKDGFISWDLPSDWIKCQVNSLPELPYNSPTGDGQGFYWVEITSSQNLNNALIRWLGVIWTSQSFLTERWAEVISDNYLPTGKTDWYEVIEMSTKDVANDLNISNLIDYELQAKDISELANMTALKTLINILLPFRSSETLREMREEFKELYITAKRVRLKSIDMDKDEKISSSEKLPFTNTRIMRG